MHRLRSTLCHKQYTPEFGPLSLVRICCSFRSSFTCRRLLITISGLEMLRVKLESGAASYNRLAMFSLLPASRRCASFARFFSSFFSRRDNRRSRSGAGAAVLVESPRPLHYMCTSRRRDKISTAEKI